MLDCFAGSGTLGRVALRMNRIPVLCEQKEEYIEEIKRRSEGIQYLELKGNENVVKDFQEILLKLDIPCVLER